MPSLDRYEAILEKVRRGLSQPEIARQCGVSRKTIRRWARANGFPERKTALRHSLVEVHREYLEQRWRQGCHNAAQLWRELRKRGFTSYPAIVRLWLRRRYGRKRERKQQPVLRPVQPHASPRKAAWQILK